MPTIEHHYGGFIIHGRNHGREGTLVQTDWDYPSTAAEFGWNLRRVQPGKRVQCKCNGDFDRCYSCDNRGSYVKARVLKRAPNRGSGCDHRGTDGTADCPNCGVRASEFIGAAGEFLSDIAR